MNQVTFKILPNHVILAVAKNHGVNSVVVLAGVKVGSRDEPKGLHGAAHFVEHMLFKGTKSRPSAKILSSLIDSKGGIHNASTGKESTEFHIMMAKQDGNLALDVVHDMLVNPLLRSKDVESERSVIREEITSYDNDPFSCVWELSDRVAYAGSGLEHRITGSATDVSFSSKRLKTFFLNNYVPSKTMVVLTGNVSDSLISSAEKKFGSIGTERDKRENVERNRFADAQSFNIKRPRPGFHFEAGKTDKLEILLRFPGVPAWHPKALSLDLLATILGGYSSARLFQSLREKHGLCYSVWSNHYQHSDVGSVFIGTSIDKQKLIPAMDVLMKEIALLRKDISEEEVKNAKTYWRGASLLRADHPMSVATDIVDQQFKNGSYECPSKRVKRMMRVTRGEVIRTANDYLSAGKVHVAVVGPRTSKREVQEAFSKHAWLKS